MTRQARSCTEEAPCRSCGALMLWTITEAGKKMPVDSLPVIDGNVVLLHRKSTNELLSFRYIGTEHPPPRKRYVSHFTTCPAATEHRRSR